MDRVHWVALLATLFVGCSWKSEDQKLADQMKWLNVPVQFYSEEARPGVVVDTALVPGTDLQRVYVKSPAGDVTAVLTSSAREYPQGTSVTVGWMLFRTRYGRGETVNVLLQ